MNLLDCNYEQVAANEDGTFHYCCIQCGHERDSHYLPCMLHRRCPEALKQDVQQNDIGTGTELKRLLRRFGFRITQGCKCVKRAAEMDQLGVGWCRENIGLITDWLEEEAHRRSLPFLRAAGKVLIRRAIKNAERKAKYLEGTTSSPEPISKPKAVVNRMKWVYAVTTVPSRVEDLLPRTLESLERAGFGSPTLCVDGSRDYTKYLHYGLQITMRYPRVRVAGNWILSLWELYLREPEMDRYAIFQDDFVTYRNLRQYLDQCLYPEKGYWNLFTFMENDVKIVGVPKGTWVLSSQNGRGAVGIVLNREATITLLGHPHLSKRLQNTQRGKEPNSRRGWEKIDGGIVESFRAAGWQEWVHCPSLIQHTGDKSACGSRGMPIAKSFLGEDFDAMELLE